MSAGKDDMLPHVNELNKDVLYVDGQQITEKDIGVGVYWQSGDVRDYGTLKAWHSKGIFIIFSVRLPGYEFERPYVALCNPDEVHFI